jgi:hypothetical protein
MKVLMTEYLRIDLDTEQWECRVCDHTIGTAAKSYKEGMLVHNRDPARSTHPSSIRRSTASPSAPIRNGCASSNTTAPLRDHG